MKRLILVLVLSFTMVFAFSGMAVAEEEHVEHYQISDTIDRVVNVDSEEEFTSIQAAINAAEPEETIRVKAGIYEEDILVDVDNLTIEAEEEHAATIKGEILIGDNQDYNSADGVELRGFVFEHPDGEPDDLDDDTSDVAIGINSEEITTENNIVKYFLTGVGMDFANFDAKDIEIIDNEFVKCRSSVAQTEDAEDITIDGNEFNEVYNALSLGGPIEDDVKISNNDFNDTENRHIGVYEDVEIANMDTLLEDNDFDKAAFVDDVEEGLTEGIWSEIQDAVDNAAEEATIEVAEGTYEERIEIDVDDITLEASEGKPKLKHSERIIEFKEKSDAQSLTVEGFEFKGDASIAINLRPGTVEGEIELFDNVFTNDMMALNSDSVHLDGEIKDNEFNGRKGISLRNADMKVKENEFNDLPEAGIELFDNEDEYEGNGDLVISNNEFKDGHFHIDDVSDGDIVIDLKEILNDNEFPFEAVVTDENTIEDIDEFTDDIATIEWEDEDEITIDTTEPLEVEIDVGLNEVAMEASDENKQVKAIDNSAFFYTIEYTDEADVEFGTEEIIDTSKGHDELEEALEEGTAVLEIDEDEEFSDAGKYNLEVHAGVLKQ